MKIFKYIAISLSLSAFLYGGEYGYLFDGSGAKNSGFGGIDIKSSNVGGTSAIGIGGHGAWLVNDTFYMGLSGFATKDDDLSIGYGGLMFGLHLFPTFIIHPNLTIVAGQGSVREKYDVNATSQCQANNDCEKDTRSDTINVVETQLGLEININKWLRVNPYISQRTVYKVSNPKYSNSDFSGTSYGVALHFGFWK